MKKVFKSLRDTVIAGTLFLLPVLGLIVLITKIFHMFQAYAAKLADLLGLDSLAGIPTPVLVVSISLVAICLLCGYLVRITFFKHISAWIDEKLRKLVPGYEKYHQLAALKLKGEEMFPHEMAAWIKTERGIQPGFIIEATTDGSLVVFFPDAGDVRRGSVLLVDPRDVSRCPDADVKKFKLAITNLGSGISKFVQQRGMMEESPSE